VLWEGKVRVWGRNEMTEGGWCGLHTYIERGRVRPHVLGRFVMWGIGGALWLVQEDGRVGERDPKGALLWKGRCCKFINVYCKNRYMHVCLPSSSLQALEDKEERACYSTIRPGIGEGAEVVYRMVWRSFKKV
jgi:hypothetical protein